AHKFEDPSKVFFHVPAANNPDGWTPQWGILELGFEARSNPPETRTLSSIFEFAVDGNSAQVERNEFKIGFDVVEPFRTFPESLDVGQLDESSKSVEREVLVYSLTRPQPDYPFPTPGVGTYPGGDVDKFVKVGSPTPVPAEELEGLGQKLTKETGRPVKVTAAYKVPVSVSAKVGDQRLDIGQLEQRIHVSLAGVDPKFVTIRGTVRGGVWLSSGNAIELGGFKSRDGVAAANFELVTDR